MHTFYRCRTGKNNIVLDFYVEPIGYILIVKFVCLGQYWTLWKSHMDLHRIILVRGKWKGGRVFWWSKNMKEGQGPGTMKKKIMVKMKESSMMTESGYWQKDGHWTRGSYLDNAQKVKDNYQRQIGKNLDGHPAILPDNFEVHGD